MVSVQSEVENFLRILRETHPSMVEIYTRGGCYALYELLKSVFPHVEPYHDPIEGHVYSEIAPGFFADILGVHKRSDLVPLHVSLPIGAKPEEWKREAFWK